MISRSEVKLKTTFFTLYIIKKTYENVNFSCSWIPVAIFQLSECREAVKSSMVVVATAS